MSLGIGVRINHHAAPFWSPLRETSRVLWYSADQGLTYDGSNRVSAVTDLSGKGRSASQSTDAQKPVYTTGGANGRPYLAFNGTSQRMAVASPAHAASDWLIVAVIDPAVATARMTLFDSYDNGSNRLWIPPVSGNVQTKVAFYDGAWREPAAATTGAQVLCWDLRAGTGTAGIYRNGTLLGAMQNYTAKGLYSYAMTFGAVFDGSFAWMNGRIYEVAMFNAPTDVLRVTATQYMGARYGITVP